jgi:hypothetical protein
VVEVSATLRSLFDAMPQGGDVTCLCGETRNPCPVHDLSAISARLSDPETSHQAARSYRPNRLTQRQRILDLLRYSAGLTDFQLSQATGIPRHIAARRRKDLVEMGLVCDSGYRRKTDNNVAAVVWRLEDDPDLADRIREEMGE